MKRQIQRFSPEIYIEDEIQTYSGGLGVLQGDGARSAADLGLSLGEISLVATRGYCRQMIVNGKIYDNVDPWDPSKHGFTFLPLKDTSVKMRHRVVKIGAWEKMIRGRSGEVPVRLLTTDLPENHPEDRDITNHVHPGEDYFKVLQAFSLGVGGIRMLRELDEIPDIVHLNESHSVFAASELKRQLGAKKARERLRNTIHTPVAAGNLVFSHALLHALGVSDELPGDAHELGGHDAFHCTDYAYASSKISNGVSQRHAQFMTERGRPMIGITNGIHPYTWASPYLQEALRQYLPAWFSDPRAILEHARIPDEALRAARAAAKHDLVELVNTLNPDARFREDLPILIVARRFAGYKHADLPLFDMERLAEISDGLLQIIFAGKAHSFDKTGKDIIMNIYWKSQQHRDRVKVELISGYDTAMAKKFVAGGDLCLQMPNRSEESSATSFMKYLLNGGAVASTRDGSVIEATNPDAVFLFGRNPSRKDPRQDLYAEDALLFYDALEHRIVPWLLSGDPGLALTRSALENAAFFSTERMMREYCEKLYGITLDEVRAAQALPGTSTT